MAKLSTEELLDAFKEMTLLELSEFVKQFEEVFEVTAAARSPSPPLAVPPRLPRPPRSRASSTSSSRAPATRRSASSRWCARSFPAWASKKPRTSSTGPEARSGEGQQGGRRGGQGQTRSRWREGHRQVVRQQAEPADSTSRNPRGQLCPRGFFLRRPC